LIEKVPKKPKKKKEMMPLMMVWIGQRDDAVVNLMMGWIGHRDHAVGDGLEWADRLSVLALPAARSWETQRICVSG
jgi:hypothetical protein